MHIQSCLPFLRNLLIEMSVQFYPSIKRTIRIKKERIVRKGLYQFCIDLSRNTFISIYYTSGSFGNLNTLYPSSRSEGQTKSLCCPSNRGNVFLRNQQIRTGQPQHSNLLCSRKCVRKTDIYRRICFKTLCQITASSF